MAEYVDWQFAINSGRKLAPAGPQLSRTEADELVAALYRGAESAIAPIAEVTELTAPASAPAEVITRPDWIELNLSTMQVLLERVGFVTKSDQAQGVAGSRIPLVTGAKELPGKANALQLAAVLAWMSNKVLGQYDAFAPDESARIVLVAPNVAHAAADLEPQLRQDFGNWVCLHEETHRVQFQAVPWLRDFLHESMTVIVQDMPMSTGQFLERMKTATRSPDMRNPVNMLQSGEARQRMSQVMALMTLLEGHADWAMDQVPEQLTSTPALREFFTARRHAKRNPLDAFLRKILGMDLKLAQYENGAEFVRQVVGKVGVSSFNRVFTAPETLPTQAEILDPPAWVFRMAG